MRSEVPEAVTSTLLTWGPQNYQGYSWRSAETPWEGMVAEILLQRTNALQVERYLPEVLEVIPTPEAGFGVSDEELAVLEGRFGLDRRSRTIRAIAGYFLSHKVPHYDELVSLYGIGHYTAAAFLSLHLDIRAVLVDSNVARWLARLSGRERPKDPRRADWLYELAARMTPEEEFRTYNYSVLDFTMMVCKRGKPKWFAISMPSFCDSTSQRQIFCTEIYSGKRARNDRRRNVASNSRKEKAIQLGGTR